MITFIEESITFEYKIKKIKLMLTQKARLKTISSDLMQAMAATVCINLLIIILYGIKTS